MPLDLDAIKARRDAALKWYHGGAWGLTVYSKSSADVPDLLTELALVTAERDALQRVAAIKAPPDPDKRADFWEAEAKRYAGNADFWCRRAQSAQPVIAKAIRWRMWSSVIAKQTPELDLAAAVDELMKS